MSASKTEELTYNEHVTRAMLIGAGWKFNGAGFYYFDADADNLSRQRLDAETLEPITWDEANARRSIEYGYNRFTFELSDG